MASVIETYFQESGEKAATLAARIGVSPSTITRAIRGERQPSFELARQIEAATNGKISAKDFMAECMEAHSPVASSEASAA